MRREIIVCISISLHFISLNIAVAQSDFEKIWQEANEQFTDTAKIDLLIDHTWQLARRNPKLGLEILKEMDIQLYQRGVSYKKDVWYYYMGVLCKNIGAFSESDTFFQAYYEYHLGRNSKPHLAAVQMVRGNLYADQGLWAQSMKVVTESLRLYEEISDTSGIITATSKLGAILLEMQRIDDGLDYHRKALQMAQVIADTAEMAIANSNIGLALEKSHLLDSALYYYHKSLQLDSIKNEQFGLIYDHHNIGNVLLKMGEYDQALPHAEKAWNIAKKIGNPGTISFSQTLLGNLYIKKGEVIRGVDLIGALLEDSTLTSLNSRSDAHESLYLAYKEMGNIAESFEHLEAFKQLSDSLLNQDISQQINNLEFEYETEKAEQNLTIANAQKDLVELKLNNSRFRNYLLGTILLLVCGFLYYFWHLNKKVKIQNQMISKTLREKDLLLREIHHRVKNNLQVISSLLSLQSKSEDDPNVVLALRQGQNRVRSMALIHQNLYEEDNLTGINVKEYFEKLIKSLFHSYNISPERINLQTEIDELQLDVETVIPLGLIVNELVTNALKYAFPHDNTGTIIVRLVELDQILHLEVADNGIGLDHLQDQKLNKSFGFRLINAFRQQLKAELRIDGKQGTCVQMDFKSFRNVS
ncbi:MAG: tetratricopeptide repeat protein [Saprospiraceae bacterium]|nr:tetratricopeptide repeat protein [Saprospiraceae bacterium]